MSRRALSIDQKIEKAEALVASTKAKYDKALDDLKMLIDKRKEMESKKIIEAYYAGNKTADEIVSFIRSEGSKDD